MFQDFDLIDFIEQTLHFPQSLSEQGHISYPLIITGQSPKVGAIYYKTYLIDGM